MKINPAAANRVARRLTKALTFAIASVLFTSAFAQGPAIEDDGITGPIHQKYLGKIVFLKEDLAKDEVTEAKLINEFTLGDLIYFRAYMKKSMMNALLEKDPSLDQPDAVNHAKFALVFSLDGGKPIETMMDFGNDDTEKNEWTSWRGALKHTRNSGLVGMDNFRQFLAESQIAQGKHTVKVTAYPAYKALRGEGTTGEFTLNVNAFNPNDSATCLPGGLLANAEIEGMFAPAYKAKGLPGIPRRVLFDKANWTIDRNRISTRIEKRHTGGVAAVNIDGECSFLRFLLVQDYSANGNYGTPYLDHVGARTKINCGCLK